MSERSQATVVDAATVPWVSGAEVFATMDAAFRDNIGTDVDAALGLLAKYHARCLWKDEESGRRIDHVRCDPGYADLSEAFHDSVEECLVVGGAVELTAEGGFVAGDYFWRPPGWVHSAASPEGFEAILMMEGAEPCEGSHHVSRVVRPDEEAGTHANDADPVGPRGYVRRVESRFMVARPVAGPGAVLWGESATAKVLSLNADTGTESSLVTVPQGWQGGGVTFEHDVFVVTRSGRLQADDQVLEPSSLVHVPAGTPAPRLVALDGLEVLFKTCPA